MTGEKPAKSLRAAVEDGDLAAVARMLARKKPDLADSGGFMGMTLLHVAADEGHAEIAALLCAAGAPLNLPCEGYHWTPLHYAATCGHALVVEVLIAAGADIEVRDGCRETPLHAAAHAGEAPVVEKLLAAGAKIEARDKFGRTPLALAIEMPLNTAAARKLVAAGASLSATDDAGNTLLHAAARRKSAAMAGYLIANGRCGDALSTNEAWESPISLWPKIMGLPEWTVLQEARKKELDMEAIKEALARVRRLGSLRPKSPTM